MMESKLGQSERKAITRSNIADRIPTEVQFIIYANLALGPKPKQGVLFDHCKPDEPEEIRNCAFKPQVPAWIKCLMLVSKSWLDVGRMFLFHTLSVVYGNDLGKRRIQSLCENPQLAMHVRALQIGVLLPPRSCVPSSTQILADARSGKSLSLGVIPDLLSAYGLDENVRSRLIEGWIKAVVEPRLPSIFSRDRMENLPLFEKLFRCTPQLNHIAVQMLTLDTKQWRDPQFDKLLSRYNLSPDMFHPVDHCHYATNENAATVMEDLTTIMPSTVNSLKVFGMPVLDKSVDLVGNLNQTRSDEGTKYLSRHPTSWGLRNIEHFWIDLCDKEMELDCDFDCEGASISIYPAPKGIPILKHESMHVLSYWAHQLLSAQNLKTLEIHCDEFQGCAIQHQDPLEILLRVWRGPNLESLRGSSGYISKGLIQSAASLPRLKSLRFVLYSHALSDQSYDVIVGIKKWLLEAQSPSLKLFRLQLRNYLVLPLPIRNGRDMEMVDGRHRLLLDDWVNRYMMSLPGNESESLLKIGASIFNRAALLSGPDRFRYT